MTARPENAYTIYVDSYEEDRGLTINRWFNIHAENYSEEALSGELAWRLLNTTLLEQGSYLDAHFRFYINSAYTDPEPDPTFRKASRTWFCPAGEIRAESIIQNGRTIVNNNTLPAQPLLDLSNVPKEDAEGYSLEMEYDGYHFLGNTYIDDVGRNGVVDINLDGWFPQFELPRVVAEQLHTDTPAVDVIFPQNAEILQNIYFKIAYK